MAISVPAASASVSSSAVSEAPSLLHHRHSHSHSKVSFSLAPKPKLRIFAKTLSSRTVAIRAQLNEVAVDGSQNDAATPQAKSVSPPKETVPESSATSLASEESISQFMDQVADLVKLVDSRDIVELQLKQLDCEIIIRKKEALPQAQTPAPMVMMQSAPPAVPSAPAAAPTPTPTLALPAPASPAPAPAKSSLPPLKSPMAGTFYRSPAPGAPPFVKVGDKVEKGQILCIIEAMKLMNEIEANQSGTIVEILVEDAKPISFDTPLFVIQP